MIETELKGKYGKLCSYLSSLGSTAVAFSGGVDSSFLLYSAREVLGERVIAVTARSCSFPARELNEAVEFCKAHGIRHYIVDSEELEIEGFSQNPINRCYLCKTELFQKIRHIADENGISEVVEGSNLEDNGDYRPGLTAVAELGIRSPLRFAGMTKDDIRMLSKEAGLPTWNKQSFACLSSRFPYGEDITKEKLSMVERAEQLLLDLGFRQVRVRIHGLMARVEILPADFTKITEPDIRGNVTKGLHSYGFTYVSLDLDGYRTGSMNEVLNQQNITKEQRA
ncbi:MAG: ATP-dependent sacrificial sulfur transferase LarE [Kiritimatiellales bacterium]